MNVCKCNLRVTSGKEKKFMFHFFVFVEVLKHISLDLV